MDVVSSGLAITNLLALKDAATGRETILLG